MNLDPEVNYIIKTLSIEKADVISFFLKYKHREESLYIGKINRSLLEFTSDEEIYNIIRTYFIEEKYNKRMSACEMDKGKDRALEDFPKLCWLTNDYNQTGFRNPLCVHYNPRTGKNVIHPGGSRNIIIKLFGTRPITCLYFNTGGVDFPWLKQFKIVNPAMFHAKTTSWYLVADHGSLIPHVHFDTTTIPDNVARYHDLISDKLKTFSFSTNVGIPFLEKWETTDSNLRFVFKKDHTSVDVCKATILGLLGIPYNSPTLQVILNAST